MSLWVHFLIYYLYCSFLINGDPLFTRYVFPKPLSERLSIQGNLQIHDSSTTQPLRCSFQVIETFVGFLRGEPPKRFDTNVPWALIRETKASSPIQKFKAMNLWIFFLIYSSSCSFLLNVGPNLVLESE